MEREKLACVQRVTDQYSESAVRVSMYWPLSERSTGSLKTESGYYLSSSALIEAVRRRRALWDTADVHHHNRLVINSLWQEVAEELGVNMILAKSKWRGLRDYYRQQLRRNGDQLSDSQTNSNWAHFNEMSFIGAAVNPRIGRIKEESSTPPTDLDIHNALDQSWQEDAVAQNWPEPVSTYKKFSESETTSNNRSMEDDDLHFFKSLIPDLKGLPRSKKVLLRLKIQQMIYDEIYKGVENGENHENQNNNSPRNVQDEGNENY